MDIPMADVMIHIQEALPGTGRDELQARLRGLDGVISVHTPDDKPHLLIVGYRPDKTQAAALLATVRAEGLHAELVGL
jgi:hypothetical protein